MTGDFDVVIAGAGPAGVALAAALARREPGLARRTVVLDKARFPRAKPCGGGLTGRALEAMRAVGLELAVPAAAAPRARVRFAGFERALRLSRPVQVVRREDFDASLLAQVRDLGVTVREGEAVASFAVREGGVEVRTSAGGLRGRVLVGADGAGSRVRRQLAPAAGGAAAIRLFRAELPAPAGWLPDEMLYDFSPMAAGVRGYLWAFPAPGGRLSVGIMHHPTTAVGGAGLVRALARGLAAHGIGLPPGVSRGWPVWGYHPGAAVAAPHLLTVGDAAGVDGLTGEGIAVALEQAAVAADAICAALASGDFAFAGYRRALRAAAVGRELALDRQLAWLLYGRRRWKSWLSCVLFDDRMLDLYAARIGGAVGLADRKAQLVGALVRHLAALPLRRWRLARWARAGRRGEPATRPPTPAPRPESDSR